MILQLWQNNWKLFFLSQNFIFEYHGNFSCIQALNSLKGIIHVFERKTIRLFVKKKIKFSKYLFFLFGIGKKIMTLKWKSEIQEGNGKAISEINSLLLVFHIAWLLANTNQRNCKSNTFLLPFFLREIVTRILHDKSLYYSY